MNTLKTLLLTLLFTNLVSNFYSQDCPIFPHPTNYQETGGEFHLGEMIAVSRRNLTQKVKDDLKWYLTHELKVNALFVNDGGDLFFERMANAPSDFYSIRIDKNITISYSTEASLFYAITSLKRLIKGEEGSYSLPKCQLTDQSKFQWRGMHLDVSRHFFTVDEVKQYIDWLARYKFNRFHWHLTDDQGWRIEIKQYPKLTEIGSLRKQTLENHASSQPEQYDGIPHKGFYTQKEIKEIVKYAADRYIEVVPEIEMPGHARAALAAYPEYSCDGKQLPVAEKWGVFDKVFCSKDETIHFLQNILDEVVELFPGDYIHIGGDEAPKTSWKKCERCQAQMTKHNLKSEEELQSFFITKMDEYLMAKGKRLIGWDEILEGGLSPNATVMSWRGTKGGIEAAEQDHFVVMTPGSHCYFDHYQSDRNTEPLAIGGYTPLEKVYAYNPIPDELANDKKGLILGAQANVWTEYMPDFEQVQYMILPRMVALSEVLWGTTTDYSDFLQRLKTHELPYFDYNGIPYSNAAFYMKSKLESTPAGIKVTFYSADESIAIVGSDPIGIGVERISESEFIFRPTAIPTTNSVSASAINGNIIDDLEISILQHNTLGKEWSISPGPSPYYSGNGAFTLTDGIRGRKPWNGKEWLGFNEGVVELELNLETKKKLKNIYINFLDAPSSWIYLPETITLLYSKNGRRWKEKEVKVSEELTKIAIGKKSKFLKLKIVPLDTIPVGSNGEGHKPWLFIDEVWME